MTRKRLAHGEKLAIVPDADTSNLYWKAKTQQFAQSRRSAKAIQKGRPSRLKDIEKDIMHWALEMKDTGVPLS